MKKPNKKIKIGDLVAYSNDFKFDAGHSDEQPLVSLKKNASLKDLMLGMVISEGDISHFGCWIVQWYERNDLENKEFDHPIQYGEHSILIWKAMAEQLKQLKR